MYLNYKIAMIVVRQLLQSVHIHQHDVSLVTTHHKPQLMFTANSCCRLQDSTQGCTLESMLQQLQMVTS